jgi:hypothetical protein
VKYCLLKFVFSQVGIFAIYILLFFGLGFFILFKLGFAGTPQGVSPIQFYISMVFSLSLIGGIILGVSEVLRIRNIAKQENITLSDFAALPKEKRNQILSEHDRRK